MKPNLAQFWPKSPISDPFIDCERAGVEPDRGSSSPLTLMSTMRWLVAALTFTCSTPFSIPPLHIPAHRPASLAAVAGERGAGGEAGGAHCRGGADGLTRRATLALGSAAALGLRAPDARAEPDAATAESVAAAVVAPDVDTTVTHKVAGSCS